MYNQKFIASLGITVALLVAATSPPAIASEKGVSAEGIAYVSGGVGDEELVTLKNGRANYSFWLVTAALGSGAYLADATVKISDSKSGKLMLETKLAGPWLFVALPNGRYAIDATYAQGHGGKPETQRSTTTINTGDHHQTVLYFDSGDKVGDTVKDNQVTK